MVGSTSIMGPLETLTFVSRLWRCCQATKDSTCQLGLFVLKTSGILSQSQQMLCKFWFQSCSKMLLFFFFAKSSRILLLLPLPSAASNLGWLWKVRGKGGAQAQKDNLFPQRLDHSVPKQTEVSCHNAELAALQNSWLEKYNKMVFFKLHMRNICTLLT